MENKTTKCQQCGKPIQYKTKKPNRCAKCRAGKVTRNDTRSKSMGTSQGEALMFILLNELLSGDYINNGYYSWLMSPKGMPLQLDRYYPEYKLAFE